jgi:carbon-monoxide dehydrogenase medium subunit
VKLAEFEYHAPRTLDEAVHLLREYGDDAKILAGGQSLVPLMALRIAAPDVLIDLNRVRDLDELALSDDVLRVGALARHRHVELREDLESRCAMLADALPKVGHVAIRNRGTVIGSLTHADPAAEWPAIALALDAEITAVGPRGTRTIAAASFFEGYMTSALDADEIATQAVFRLPTRHSGSSFEELARRHGDFAIAGAGAVLTVVDELITDARLVLIGAGATPVRVTEAEAALVGQAPTENAFTQAAEIVHDAAAPRGDIQGSAEYRRSVLRAVSRRALRRAHHRAGRASE